MKKLSFQLFFIFSFSAHADGFGINATRLIYKQGEKSINTEVRNTTTGDTYLVSASVIGTSEGKQSRYFIVTPPLFRLEAGETNKIRISMLNADLPHDRESLFFFKATAIPSAKEKKKNAKEDQTFGAVKFGVSNIIKLFYRPDGLHSSPEDAQRKLRFVPEKNGIKVTNDSPYYVSFSSIRIDSHYVNLSKAADLMLPPFSHHVYATTWHKGNVVWRTINDNGGINAYSQKIH
ncbi:hypothetical protein BTJ39_14255 [Izhakiella australiensis]|uniref:Molecular chaperone n=1 Tax=Izhakiella australiensis TaxID=1926881 RepID=A0A1S8YKP5_9GAMM|nr:molecular chaperone [Izhakiella australiensis]OON39437.1 hypothetical protein BTJ39_14255 [Izhakiella australiensis]